MSRLLEASQILRKSNVRMTLNFDSSYFERNTNKLFQLRQALKDSEVADDQLEDDSFMRRLIRDGLGIKSKLGASHCVQLKNHIESQGGVKAFLQKSPILNNVYVAMAVYNLKIQNEILRTSYVDIDEHQAQRLLAELLGEEIADETGAEAYNNICKNYNYKRAEEAIAKYVKQVTSEEIDSIKNYLRDYLEGKLSESLSISRRPVINCKTEQSESSEAISQSSPSNKSPYKLPKNSRVIQRRNRYIHTKINNRNNINSINRQRNEILMKEMELDRREAAVVAREAAVNLRESALEFREKMLVRRRISERSPPTYQSI